MHIIYGRDIKLYVEEQIFNELLKENKENLLYSHTYT